MEISAIEIAAASSVIFLASKNFNDVTY